MPELPNRKVGIVACSGEELPEGTVTRLAALRVLHDMRPDRTVTICLPLFLAGGEGDRAFARFYPTIAVDGCEQRCAARATEELSGKPAAGVVVSDLVREHGLGRPRGSRRLDEHGRRAVDVTADRIAGLVDEILGARWDRRTGTLVAPDPALEPGSGPGAAQAAGRAPEPGAAPDPAPTSDPAPEPAGPPREGCACGSGIPVATVDVDGSSVTLVALPLVFERYHAAGKAPGPEVTDEILRMVKVYNEVPGGADDAYRTALAREYAAWCAERTGTR